MSSLVKFIESCKFLEILKLLWPYLWSDDKKMKYRLIFSVVLNCLGVLTSVCTPIIFARTIDAYGSHYFSSNKTHWFLTLLVAYVGVWSLSKVFVCFREIIMFPVMERAIHLLAYNLFQHIQFLSFHYHLKRKTGEITTMIESAIHSFPPIVWSLAFVLCPLVVESICVLGVVAFLCGGFYSFILALCLLFYTLATRWGFISIMRPL